MPDITVAPHIYTPRAPDEWRRVLEVSDMGSVCRVSIQGLVLRYERRGTHSRTDYALLFDDSGRRFKTLGAAQKAEAAQKASV